MRFPFAMQRREHEFHHFHDDLVTALIEGDGERAAQLDREGAARQPDALLIAEGDGSADGLDGADPAQACGPQLLASVPSRLRRPARRRGILRPS